MKVSKTKVNKTKVKKIAKIKPPLRAAKTVALRPKKTNAIAKKKKTTPLVKKKTAVKPANDTALLKTSLPPEEPQQPDITPYAALSDEYALATAWDTLGDEEYLLDEEIWNSLYNRIKLQLLQTTYSFSIETDGANLSPYAVTPMPAFRAANEPGFLSAGSFTILRPDVPGVIFDLKISTSDEALLLDWQLSRKDAKPSSGHMALYLDGELVEAVNLQQSRCQLELTREDIGDVTFYFLDADTGKQAKILELNI